MARIDVLMPQMGESIAEGTLSKWLKKLGDEVKRDEPLFEISTDMVDAAIPGRRRRDLGVHLVGREFEQRLVPLHLVPQLLEPLAHGAFGHRLARLAPSD